MIFHLTGYAASRLRLSRRIVAAPYRLRAYLRSHFHRLGHWAHYAEKAFHTGYLGGVAFGGGYRYAAIGLLLCMAVAWLCAEE